MCGYYAAQVRMERIIPEVHILNEYKAIGEV